MARAAESRRYDQYKRRRHVLDLTPDGKTFTGSSGPRDSYNHDMLWLHNDNVPLLKNFEPIGPPPTLLVTREVPPRATK
ncbi:hypothetical protein COMA2_10460 [Candidatus Nitrospira nitrificans]|uniref:Uncharacterized protein n=1 Tax=Candidatus Nitrospira nitrificans TaxID=1742973 RepID=A0A0S4L638_9BACT|nr:hypothetical protein COMA2_10460 [Candidatus Nitrospira nitrificans]